MSNPFSRVFPHWVRRACLFIGRATVSFAGGFTGTSVYFFNVLLYERGTHRRCFCCCSGANILVVQFVMTNNATTRENLGVVNGVGASVAGAWYRMLVT